MIDQNNNTKEVKNNIYPLTPLDFQIILRYVTSPTMALLLCLCFYTGTEIRHLLEMTYGDITSMNSGMLKIHLLYGSIPDVPVDEGIAHMLQPYTEKKKQNREFLFVHDDDSTWSRAYVDKQIAMISEQSEIPFTAESLRNSYFATIVNNIVPAGKKKAKNKLLKELIAGAA